MKRPSLRSGQSLVEFALIFPIFFFLVTGLFDLGRAVFAYSTINNAVREGTRYAIVLPTPNSDTSAEDGEIKARVRSYFYNVKDLENNTIVSVTRVGDTENPKVNVHVTYTFAPITPGLAAVLGHGHTIQLQAESEMYLTPYAK